ncbi:MAG: DUF362 domain-containing protein [Melioribacter sp.]|nr:DUF362 domain-containing protein [Melioribacter sp.]
MNFVKIKTFFGEHVPRDILGMAKNYSDIALIMDSIRELSSDELNYKTLKGKRILIKPNWVLHNQKPEDELCLRTHDSIIIALVEFICNFQPSEVIIGDAPIQRCLWESILSTWLLSNIDRIQKASGVDIKIKDLRRRTFDPNFNNPVNDKNPIDDYVIFDLGEKSYLEPISLSNNFRVTSYNPDRLVEAHRKGTHKYCISKELFTADLVISVPKVKTHQKTGITCALKNLVGINGDKDFLPHHRVGGTGFGGDCYPGKNIIRRLSEYFLDQANRKQGSVEYWLWFKSAISLWKISHPQEVHKMSAGWYGNDTTWRMVMDLNLIAKYGRLDGTISAEPQRMIYSLCDGIVGGQGDGPLLPEPLALGVLGFTNNSLNMDIVMATLMRFDCQKIPLLNNNHEIREIGKIILNHKEIKINELKKYSIKTKLPPGWINYL